MDINYQDYDGYGYNSNTNLISAKEDLNKKLSSMQGEIDTSTKEIDKVLKDAPETLDTLKEVADKFEELHIDEIETALEGKADKSDVYTKNEADATFLKSASLDSYATKEYVDEQDAILTSAIDTKADSSVVTSHIEDSTIHITATERNKWNTVSASLESFIQDVNQWATSANTEIKSNTDNIESLSGKVTTIGSNVERFVGTINQWSSTVESRITKAQSDIVAVSGKAVAVDAKVDAFQNVVNQWYSTVETSLANKANTSDVYTKDEVDSALSEKADVTDVYTKGEADTKFTDMDFFSETYAAIQGQFVDWSSEMYAKFAEVYKQNSQLLTRVENLEEVNSVEVVDETVANVPAGSNVVVTSAEAVQSMTGNTEFNTITIVGGNTNKDIKAIAADKVTIDGMTVNGEKGASNGRMQLSANTVTLKNISIESGSTAYNVFESSQNTSKSEYFTKEFNVSGLNVDNTLLNHNVVNIYTFADDAVVNFKDSYLNLDVDNSNALRLANYSNATGVTVNFENVTWTYENAEGSDWAWAGLVIYQPASSDVALSGDNSKLATWKFNFKNCKYVTYDEQGLPTETVVNAVNFGQHNQVIYGYNLSNSGNVSDISQIAGITITFE